MRRFISLVLIILLIITMFGVLTGNDNQMTFDSFLFSINDAPTISFDWLQIPSLQIEDDGVLGWLLGFVNTIIDIVNFALLVVRGFLQLGAVLIYYVKSFFVKA